MSDKIKIITLAHKIALRKRDNQPFDLIVELREKIIQKLNKPKKATKRKKHTVESNKKKVTKRKKHSPQANKKKGRRKYDTHVDPNAPVCRECKENPRHLQPSGKHLPYCLPCQRVRWKASKAKASKQ